MHLCSHFYSYLLKFSSFIFLRVCKRFFWLVKVLQQYLRRQWPIEQRVTKDSLVSNKESLVLPRAAPIPRLPAALGVPTEENTTHKSASQEAALTPALVWTESEPAGHWSQWFQTCHLNRTRCTKNIWTPLKKYLDTLNTSLNLPYSIF